MNPDNRNSLIQNSLLTGANPGHSYTVKSPSSFSSSVDAPESGTFGSSLCLQRSHTQRHKTFSTDSMRQRGQEETRACGRHTWSRGMNVSSLGADLLLQGEHLLLLVLVVVHLGTVSQVPVPRLENTTGQRGHEKIRGIHPQPVTPFS